MKFASLFMQSPSLYVLSHMAVIIFIITIPIFSYFFSLSFRAQDFFNMFSTIDFIRRLPG